MVPKASWLDPVTLLAWALMPFGLVGGLMTEAGIRYDDWLYRRRRAAS